MFFVKLKSIQTEKHISSTSMKLLYEMVISTRLKYGGNMLNA